MKKSLLIVLAILSLLVPVFPYQAVYAQDVVPYTPAPRDTFRPLVTPSPVPLPPVFAPPDPPVRPMPQPFPEIKYHRVEVDIEGQVVVTRVEMLFVNSSGMMLEGTYLFPLPADAAISSLVMWADGQKMVGEIMDKEQARQLYESIVRQRRDPALLQYVGSRAVELRVFPLPPKGERKIQIEYSHFLSSEAGAVKYVYPLAGTGFPGKAIGELTVTVRIKARESLGKVYSPGHEIAINRKNEKEVTAGFEASNVTSLKDFELNYSLSEKEISLNVLSFRDGNKGYFLLLIAPPIEVLRDEIVARDIILVVDVSGSMAGTKLEQAKEAMRFVLEKLNPQDRFNVLTFSTSVSSFADTMRPVSGKSEALKYISDLKAAGSTNIHDALDKAMRMVSEGRPTTILLLTDGRPTVGITDEKGILNVVTGGKKEYLRLFTFGIGSDVDRDLLDSLSRYGRGTSQYISKDNEISALVSSLYEKISTPVLLGLKLDFKGMNIEEVYPYPLPDLYAGSQLIIAGRYREDGEAAITLRGRSTFKEEQFVYEKVKFSSATVNSFIPAQWAMKKVGYLLEQIKLEGESRSMVDEVKALSQQYGIMTPYTSYFVKEDMPVPMPFPVPAPAVRAFSGDAPQNRPAGAAGGAVQSESSAKGSVYIPVTPPVMSGPDTPVSSGNPSVTPDGGFRDGNNGGRISAENGGNPGYATAPYTGSGIDEPGQERDEGVWQRLWNWIVNLFRK